MKIREVVERVVEDDAFRLEDVRIGDKKYDIEIREDREDGRGRFAIRFFPPGSKLMLYCMWVNNGRLNIERLTRRPNHDHNDRDRLMQDGTWSKEWSRKDGPGPAQIFFGERVVSY